MEFSKCSKCGSERHEVEKGTNVMGERFYKVICVNCGHILNFRRKCFITGEWTDSKGTCITK